MVTLATNNELSAEFTAPVNDNLTFEVIATDSDGNQDSDTINITVLPANVAHRAILSWSPPLYN